MDLRAQGIFLCLAGKSSLEHPALNSDPSGEAEHTKWRREKLQDVAKASPVGGSTAKGWSCEILPQLLFAIPNAAA